MCPPSKIQKEPVCCETLKHVARYHIVGDSTSFDPKDAPTIIPDEVIMATPEEIEEQVTTFTSASGRGQRTNSAKSRQPPS